MRNNNSLPIRERLAYWLLRRVALWLHRRESARWGLCECGSPDCDYSSPGCPLCGGYW